MRRGHHVDEFDFTDAAAVGSALIVVGQE